MSDANSAVSRSLTQSEREVAASTGASLVALCDTLRDATLDVVWRQWAAVGAMAAASRRAASLIDPEALVLMSLALAGSEPRLVDLLADWAALNSDLVSVQRTRNLAERYPAPVRAGVIAFARVAFEEGRDHRWKSLLAGAKDGGLQLSRRGNKARAIRVQPLEPPALMLRLRLAFGVGIKADVLAFLLGADPGVWASVSDVAAATGYTVAAVRKAIHDLVDARIIREVSGTRSEFHAPQADWAALLETPKLARWRGWNDCFVFVAAFLEWAGDAATRPLTPYVMDSRGRILLEAHADAFRWQQRAEEGPHQTLAEEGDLLTLAVHGLGAWMRREA